jgi:hypothetical protein
MTFQEFLATVTEEERDFVARLDYGQDFDTHRKALDVAIANGGVVDTAIQGGWFPLEVLELGRNVCQSGHEREFVLCAGIVLQTASIGDEVEGPNRTGTLRPRGGCRDRPARIAAQSTASE